MSISKENVHVVPYEDPSSPIVGARVPRRAPNLKRELRSWHILMIGIGGTIGLGLFGNTGTTLALAGPGGAMLAFVIVGLIAIAVMEGICEMIVLWPISNAMIEFVRAFVDRDLAIVVGFGYWYTYLTTFIGLIIGAGNLLNFWGISAAWKTVACVLFLIILALINSRGVKLYGDIELVGGILKILFLVGLFLLMLIINGGVSGSPRIGSTAFNDGIRNNPEVAGSRFTAVIIAIPIVTYAYLGTELITVTAFEAVNPNELKGPAKNIAYYISALYIFNVLGFVLNVEWFNQNLPAYFKQDLVHPNSTDLGHTPIQFGAGPTNSDSPPVIATLQANIPGLPGFITGCMVYSALSSANTALYVASRTLYGLTRDLDAESDSKIISFFARFNFITPNTNVPGWAILLSLVSFIWLPFVQFDSQVTQQELQEVMFDIGSVTLVLVWASQCLAFIRYHSWLKKHRNHLKGNYARFNRWEDASFRSWFSAIQPLPAWLGLISCLAIVVVLNSASMWNGKQVVLKSVTAYLGPALLVVIYVILKLINRRPWVELGEWRELRQTLNDLDALIYHAPQMSSPTEVRTISPLSVPGTAVSNFSRRGTSAYTGA